MELYKKIIMYTLPLVAFTFGCGERPVVSANINGYNVEIYDNKTTLRKPRSGSSRRIITLIDNGNDGSIDSKTEWSGVGSKFGGASALRQLEVTVKDQEAADKTLSDLRRKLP